MQIYALDTHSSLISARQAHRHLNYTCLECHAPVRLRGGKQRQLHFYHPDPTNCRRHAKSLIHLHIQYALQKNLSPHTIWLEKRFPQIGRVADVVWPAKNLIFEVQVSPISANEIQQRNSDYKSIGYDVIWILHDKHFNQKRLKPAEIALRFSPHYFTNFTAFEKGFFYDQATQIRHKRRLKRSARFSVDFKSVHLPNLKQVPRQIPFERRKWRYSFGGDLFDRKFDWKSIQNEKVTLLSRFTSFIRSIYMLLLESVSN